MNEKFEAWFRARSFGPELLEALRELVTFCQESTPPDFHDPAGYPEMYAALVHAEQAIAMADGTYDHER